MVWCLKFHTVVFQGLYFLIFKFTFISGCAGSLLLHVAFSSCGEQGLLFHVVHGLLIVIASLVAAHGL